MSTKVRCIYIEEDNIPLFMAVIQKSTVFLLDLAEHFEELKLEDNESWEIAQPEFRTGCLATAELLSMLDTAIKSTETKEKTVN